MYSSLRGLPWAFGWWIPAYAGMTNTWIAALRSHKAI